MERGGRYMALLMLLELLLIIDGLLFMSIVYIPALEAECAAAGQPLYAVCR